MSVSSGGLLPLDYAMLSRPAVTIYGDGDADVLADDGPRLDALGGRGPCGAATADAGAWTPTRIDVPDRDPIDPDRVAPIAWPGPNPRATQPASAADPCVVVAGPTAARLFRAARAHGSARWLVGGKVRTLIVRALLPGEPPCGR